MSKEDELTQVIAEAVKRHLLGPDWRHVATAYPLTAKGDINAASHWWNTDNAHGKRREGSPAITVRNSNKWVATVLTSPTGKNQTIYFPAGESTLIPVVRR